MFAVSTLAAVVVYKLVVEPNTAGPSGSSGSNSRTASNSEYVRQRLLKLAKGGDGGGGGGATELTRLTKGSRAAVAPKPASKPPADDYLQRRMMQLARTPISQIPVRDI